MHEIMKKIDDLLTSLEAKTEKIRLDEETITKKLHATNEKEREMDARLSVLRNKEKVVDEMTKKVNIIKESEAKIDELRKLQGQLNAKQEAFSKYVAEKSAELKAKEDELNKFKTLYAEKDRRLEDAKKQFEDQKKSSLLKFVESELARK